MAPAGYHFGRCRYSIISPAKNIANGCLDCSLRLFCRRPHILSTSNLPAISTDSMRCTTTANGNLNLSTRVYTNCNEATQIVRGDFNKLHTGFWTRRDGWWHTWRRGAHGRFESFQCMASWFPIGSMVRALQLTTT